MIPRYLLEFSLAALSMGVACTIFLWGDARLGAYVLWLSWVSLEGLRLVWSAVLFGVGLSQAVIVGVCVHFSGESNCGTCPRPCTEKRDLRSLRAGVALISAVIWMLASFTFAAGSVRMVALGVAPLLAFFQFVVFTILAHSKVQRWRG